MLRTEKRMTIFRSIHGCPSLSPTRFASVREANDYKLLVEMIALRTINYERAGERTAREC